MINHKTLAKYLAKMFVKQFLVVSIIIICVLFVTSAFDILQKFRSANLTFSEFGMLVALKIPYLFCEVIPLISFISTFAFLRNISKQNELVIILSSGIPIWQVFIPHIFVTFCMGVIILTVVNPIGTYGLQEYEKLDAKIYKTESLNFVISQAGLLFFEKFAGENRIIQTKSINNNTSSLTNVTVLLIDDNNKLIKRIDSSKAVLKTGMFELDSPIVTTNDSSEKVTSINLPTNLSINNLMQRFSPPEMISIWNLRNSIEEFANSGLVVTRYEIYYYKQLFKALTMVAMSFIACWFISLNIRDNSGARAAILSLVSGVGGYFFLEMTLRILSYSGLSPMIATLLPILFIILISNFVILHLQEA